MTKWLEVLLAEFAVIRAAPRSFAIATITAITVATVTIWLALNWSKDAQIALLRDRIAAYEQKLQGATPDQVAQEIARLRAEVEALKNQPRDPNSLYQDGRVVASIAGFTIDGPGELITFQVVTASDMLDMSKAFEFRRFVLLCGGQPIGALSFGAIRQVNYPNVRCRITGNR